MLSALSPRITSADGHSLMSESVESLLSLYSMITADGLSLNSGTPDLYRKSQTDIARHAADFVRSSGGRSGIKCKAYLFSFLIFLNLFLNLFVLCRLHNLTEILATVSDRFVGHIDYGNSVQSRIANWGHLGRGQTVKPLISLTRKALYILGDRSQAKVSCIFHQNQKFVSVN